MKKALKIFIPVVAVLALIYFFYPSIAFRILSLIDDEQEEVVNLDPGTDEIVRFKVNLREYEPDNKYFGNDFLINSSKEKGFVELQDNHIKLLLKSTVKFHLFNQSIKEFKFYPELSRLRLCYWEYVINQLPSFVYYGDKYEGYSKRDNWISPIIAYLVYRFDRSPENIRMFFDRYKKDIYSLVTERIYDEMYVRKYLDALIAIYDQLSTIENHDRVLEEIALKTNDTDTGVISKYPLYKNLINWNLVKDFEELNKFTDQIKQSNTTVIWLYSFWVRRHSENNSKTVYEILKEIREHYKYLG